MIKTTLFGSKESSDDLGATLIWVSLLSVVGMCAGIDHFNHFQLDLLANFQGLFAFASVVTLISALMRRNILVVVLSTAGLLVYSQIRPVRYLFDGSDETSSGVVRLVSLNIERGNTSPENAAQFFLGLNPDVILLFEYTGPIDQSLNNLQEQWKYKIVLPRDDFHGLAVYSRWPLSAIVIHEFGYSKIPSAEFTIETNHGSLAVIATHTLAPLDQVSFEGRNLQLQELGKRALERSALEPVVLAGDLNMTVYSKSFRELLADTKLRDVDYTRWNQWGSWPTWLTGLLAIDHVLVSDRVAVLNGFRGARVGSDHFPVVVDLNLRSSPMPDKQQ